MCCDLLHHHQCALHRLGQDKPRVFAAARKWEKKRGHILPRPAASLMVTVVLQSTAGNGKSGLGNQQTKVFPKARKSMQNKVQVKNT